MTLFNSSYILPIIFYVNVFIFLVSMTKSKYISYNYHLTFITFHAGLDWTSLQEGIFFNILFIFDCAGSSLALGFFSNSGKQGLLSSSCTWASHCGDFFCHRAWILDLVGFNRFGSQVLEHRLNSCGTRAWLLCDTCDFADQEPVSPALGGGFFTTEIVRKTRRDFYLSFPRIHFSINICWI